MRLNLAAFRAAAAATPSSAVDTAKSFLERHAAYRSAVSAAILAGDTAAVAQAVAALTQILQILCDQRALWLTGQIKKKADAGHLAGVEPLWEELEAALLELRKDLAAVILDACSPTPES